VHVKAAFKTLVKLTPGGNHIKKCNLKKSKLVLDSLMVHYINLDYTTVLL